MIVDKSAWLPRHIVYARIPCSCVFPFFFPAYFARGSALLFGHLLFISSTVLNGSFF
ncbi:hypothetical protein B0H19DRAFT_1204092 [Mycena capillaripes]|nr:hypothetical protein B0H19DRAFT_1204092 [Mycena capillaripes]